MTSADIDAIAPNAGLGLVLARDLVARLRLRYPEIPYHRDGLHREAADEIERLREDALMLRELLRNAQTAICSREKSGWRGGTTCGQAAEALHKTRYLRPNAPQTEPQSQP
jgi:hypothetical protein